MKHPKLVRTLSAALFVLAAPWLALLCASFFVSLPPELSGERSYGSSTRILDRNGALLRHARGDDGTLGQPVRLCDVSPDVVRALLAAEDRRFYAHPGVDPIAIARAAAQAALAGRFVSGASTITQQLARTVRPRPRSLLGKVSEMALALRIERTLSKDRILEEYLSRAPFGPGVRGIEAASRAYLDEPASELSLAEAALLVSLPRGPSLYDPSRHLDRALRRRDRVLARMEAMGLASPDEVRRAQREQVALARLSAGPIATHLVRAVRGGRLSLSDASLAFPPQEAEEIATTLDAALQREAETLVRSAVRELEAHRASAAAAIVLDNATGDVLAYVGSPGDEASLGWNDGVLAARQPGSALKPFVYELAMERLAMTSATVLPDVALSFPSGEGEFRPENYDGRFHGPVSLREALGSSYNVPAVWTAARLGPEQVLVRLRALGLSTLDGPADRYGAAIALGDGEVRLLDLAAAYATLARGGDWLPPRAVRSFRDAQGDHGAPQPVGVRVLDPTRAALITRILSDDKARLASFGEGSALAFDFPVAAKTGTSKGFRDNLAVAYTREVTVAVWVGNFDGSAMEGVSGITGAGPLLHGLVLAAMRNIPVPAPLAPSDLALDHADVCPLSGLRPGPACPHHRLESFAAGTAPTATCQVHVRARIDPKNGLLAGHGCADAVERTFEAHDARIRPWAEAAGRPVLPIASSPRCPLPAPARGRVRVLYPRDGARFVHDGSLGAAREAISIRVEADGPAPHARVVVDGVRHPVSGSELSFAWPLVPGEHVAFAEADGARSEEIHFTVE